MRAPTGWSDRSLRSVLLAGGLGATLGLAACVEERVTPTATSALADSADMVMFAMERSVFQDGVRRALILADTAYTYQNTQIMEFRTLRVTFFDASGIQTSVLTAGAGTYRIQSEALDARQDVVVLSADGKRLNSQHLLYDKAANQVKTDSAFTYQSASEYVQGNGFTSDPEFRNPVIRQARGRQRGEGMLLPGQRP